LLPLRIASAALTTRPERRRFGDDPSQVADLLVPDGDGPHPVVVLLHGGYWQTKYGKLVLRPLMKDLVGRGFAAWNLEYRRLGTGRGGGGGWPQTFDDVGNGIDALVGEKRLDLDRGVAVVGHSAGGQLALWAAARKGARVPIRRVVALAPVTNVERTGERGQALLGGTPAEVPERFAAADPIRRAPLDVPVLIVHPQDDATVPVSRSREYAAKGGRVELVEPPHGGHRSPIDPTTDAWRAAASWLAQS
jgi:dipeptidyl aminopeptidase/acylaminoacyl peptidase